MLTIQADKNFSHIEFFVTALMNAVVAGNRLSTFSRNISYLLYIHLAPTQKMSQKLLSEI